jgi:hypothetical protein
MSLEEPVASQMTADMASRTVGKTVQQKGRSLATALI